MKHEKLLPVLEAGCFGLLLIILAGSDTRKDSSEPLAFSMLIMGILLIAAIFLILLEACFFRTPKKRMLTLISFKDGHPYHVYEIADEDLFLFCTSKFDLNYLIIDKAFRETINQLSKPDKNSRVTVEKWRRQLRMYSQNDSAELVFLSFNFPGGNQADVLPLAAVPDFTDAAIRTMQANCPEKKYFAPGMNWNNGRTVSTTRYGKRFREKSKISNESAGECGNSTPNRTGRCHENYL